MMSSSCNNTTITNSNESADAEDIESGSVGSGRQQQRQVELERDDGAAAVAAAAAALATAKSHSNINGSVNGSVNGNNSSSNCFNDNKKNYNNNDDGVGNDVPLVNFKYETEESVIALPNNISREDQLEMLPAEVLSGNPERPLLHIDDATDEEYHYSLNPLLYSVIFILLVELLERFSFYGINYTQTLYLTGAYNDDWNAGLGSIAASSYVAISTAIAYTSPFLGAFLADRYLGDYYTVLCGAIVFYLPGLLLIAASTIPHGIFHDVPDFDKKSLRLGLLCLWPVGTGIVKSVVNVFGAKQHHPILQTSLIESYYVNFYMCINIGALVGGILVPLVAQQNVTVAYFIPVLMLTLGILCFLTGTKRYVRSKPPIVMAMEQNKINGKNGQGQAYSKGKLPPLKSASTMTDTTYSSTSDDAALSGLASIAGVSLLVVPFNIAYSQMATTFIVQGTVMKKAFKYIDAATMNNADAIAVLIVGYLVGNRLYPFLNRHNIKIATSHKFALGSFLGALAILWSLFLEYKIHHSYATTRSQVSVLWQSVSYILIGAGEIFAVSAAYEVAFSAAPKKYKALASAANLFFIGGFPNFCCIGLYNVCRHWFFNTKTGQPHISHVDEYVNANVYKYFILLFLIATTGVIVNVLPWTNRYVSNIEQAAADMNRSANATPMSTPRASPKPSPRQVLIKQRLLQQKQAQKQEQEFIQNKLMHQFQLQQKRQKAGGSGTANRNKENENAADSETTALLQKAKKHRDYLKYGSGPVLYKSGSMRAGPCLANNHPESNKKQKKVKIKKVVKVPRTSPPTTMTVQGQQGQRMRLLMPPGSASGSPMITRSASASSFTKIATTASVSPSMSTTKKFLVSVPLPPKTDRNDASTSRKASPSNKGHVNK